MLIARAVFALALVASETSAPGEPTARADAFQQEQQLQALILRIASPIASAGSIREFEEELRRVSAGAELPQLLVQITQLTLRRPELARLPNNLDSILELYVDTFGEANEGKLRQLFDMSLELADRSATLASPLIDEGELSEALLTRELTQMPDDEDVLQYFNSLVCGLAAAAAAEGGANLSTSEEVRQAILDRWFQGTKWILEVTDPIQAALDRALDSIEQRRYGQYVFRLAYTRSRQSAEGEPVLVVWFVLNDDAPDEALDLVTDPKVRSLIEAEIHAANSSEGLPVYYRAQLASEMGPAEELLAK